MIGDTREAIEVYCVAVGLVVYEWNDLHEKLARLFALVREGDRQETRTGVCGTSKRLPRWRNPLDFRLRLSPKCRQTICAWCSADCDRVVARTTRQRTAALG